MNVQNALETIDIKSDQTLDKINLDMKSNEKEELKDNIKNNNLKEVEAINENEKHKKNETNKENNSLYNLKNNEKKELEDNFTNNNLKEMKKINEQKNKDGKTIVEKNNENLLEIKPVNKLNILEIAHNGEAKDNPINEEEENKINKTQGNKDAEKINNDIIEKKIKNNEVDCHDKNYIKIENKRDIISKEIEKKFNIEGNEKDNNNQQGENRDDIIDINIQNNILKKNSNFDLEKNIKGEEDIIDEEANNNIKASNLEKYSNFNKIKNIDKNNNQQEDIDSSDSSDDEYYGNYNSEKNKEVCGIKNLGNNCYLNSGLQILASCEELIELIEQDEFDNIGKLTSLFKNAMISLLNKKIYNPKKFIECFCKLNIDFIKGHQGCSQNFIRTIIRNINKVCIDQKFDLVLKNDQYINEDNKEYEKFIGNIFPESKIMSLFSGMTKCHSYGICPRCGEKINNYSFSYFIDQNMYLDEFDYKCKFSDVLKANIGNDNILTMDCPKCHKEIDVKDETKYIKLPDILIFTLERYQGPTNKVSIVPNEIIDMKDYIENPLNVDCTIYELFAINIRFGSNANFGHEICQVKRKGKWYQINDSYGYEIESPSNFDSSYGLFYRKRKNQEKYEDSIFGSNDVIKVNNSNSQNWFCLIWNFLTSPLYLLFSKEKYNINYLKQGLYIISACDNLIDELSLINIKNRNIITVTKEAIFKILEKDLYDDSDFIKEFQKNNKDYKLDKEYNSIDFISMLINNVDNEFVKIKYNLYDKNNLKYSPQNDKEIIEYNSFISNIFPQSLALFTFSGIIETYNYGKCKCGQSINEYSFEDFIIQKISLDSIINSDFSKILKEYFSIKNNKIKCNKCTKKIKLKVKKKYIKLGNILIFTLENNNKNINIKPIEIIDLKNYVDDSLKEEMSRYELFAISIKLGVEGNYNNELCRIKRNGNWYEINDMNMDKRNNNINEKIYGLFYKKIKN